MAIGAARAGLWVPGAAAPPGDDPAILVTPTGSEVNTEPYVNVAPGGPALNTGLTGGEAAYANYGPGAVNNALNGRALAGTNLSGGYVDMVSLGAAFTVIVDWAPGVSSTRHMLDSRTGYTGAESAGLNIFRAAGNANFRCNLTGSDGVQDATISTPTDSLPRRYAIVRDGTAVGFRTIANNSRGAIEGSANGTLTGSGAFGIPGESRLKIGPRTGDNDSGLTWYQLAIWTGKALTDQELIDYAWNDV